MSSCGAAMMARSRMLSSWRVVTRLASCAGPRLAAELRLRCWRPGQPARRAVEAAPEMEVE